jgi:hypothetical protein
MGFGGFFVLEYSKRGFFVNENQVDYGLKRLSKHLIAIVSLQCLKGLNPMLFLLHSQIIL